MMIFVKLGGVGLTVGDGEALGDGDAVGEGETVGVGVWPSAEETASNPEVATMRNADAVRERMERVILSFRAGK